MSPRRSAAEARRTRERIIERSVALASLEGLEGLTIGRLASDLGISKSGLLGHFGTKEALQIAALERAAVIFDREVWRPAADAAPGLARLRAVCTTWISYLERGVFPGGCLFVASTFEYDGRDGPVRDLLRRQFGAWRRRLVADVRVAAGRGELPPDTDPEQVVFELNGILMSLNHTIQLYGDTGAAARARRAVDRLLPPPPAGPAGPQRPGESGTPSKPA
ncbi:TetR/AcrR family transcriptional regulator [Streptomyces macrosporus]|uniref:TetR/AcrR family transcriptional regulator n=1 Tax=Streptomyces macrosporus TaxID=44032 RepID=A0ABN3JWS6_9ACTN